MVTIIPHRRRSNNSRLRRDRLLQRVESVNTRLEEALLRRSYCESLKRQKALHAEIQKEAIYLKELHWLYEQMRCLRLLPVFIPPAAQGPAYGLLDKMDLNGPPSLFISAPCRPCSAGQSLEKLEEEAELLESTLRDMQPNLPSPQELAQLSIDAKSVGYTASTLEIVKKFCREGDNEKEVLQDLQNAIQDIEDYVEYARNIHGDAVFQHSEGYFRIIKAIQSRESCGS